MTTYPVSIPYHRPSRVPGNRAKIAALAVEICEYANSRFARGNGPNMVFHSSDIANAIGADRETVRRLCMQMDGGSNGFTVVHSLGDQVLPGRI